MLHPQQQHPTPPTKSKSMQEPMAIEDEDLPAEIQDEHGEAWTMNGVVFVGGGELCQCICHETSIGWSEKGPTTMTSETTWPHTHAGV